MINNLLLLNKLKPVDVGFFVGCAVVIALIVAVYFLIPVFNKKQYQEQRENLKKREAAFNANRKTSVVEEKKEDSIVDEFEKVVNEETVSNVDESVGLDCGFANLSDGKTIEAIDGLEKNSSESVDDNK